MNLFAHFISEAGFNPKDYPRLTGIPVNYIDRKDRRIAEDVVFSEPLFCKNPESFKRFQRFLEESEKNVLVSELQIKIADNSIIVNPRSPDVKIFLR